MYIYMSVGGLIGVSDERWGGSLVVEGDEGLVVVWWGLCGEGL